MDLIIKLSCVSSSQKKTAGEDIVCHVLHIMRLYVGRNYFIFGLAKKSHY